MRGGGESGEADGGRGEAGGESLDSVDHPGNFT